MGTTCVAIAASFGVRVLADAVDDVEVGLVVDAGRLGRDSAPMSARTKAGEVAVGLVTDIDAAPALGPTAAVALSARIC